MVLRAAFVELLEVLAPSRCPGCDLPEPGGVFCGACEPLLEPAGLASSIVTDGDCAAFLYEGPLADALRRLKYRKRTDLAPALGLRLAAAAPRFGGLVDVVIPIPLHSRRLASRGFNQSGLLAAPVARALAVPLRPRWLRRMRPTPPQVGLPREQRATNVKGAFRASHRVRGLRVLLVDDVRTTGATLASARAALLAEGATTIHGLALAQAGDEPRTEDDRRPDSHVRGVCRDPHPLR